MSDLAHLKIWDNPAIRDSLSWYLDVAENRRPAKFRILATQIDPAAASEEPRFELLPWVRSLTHWPEAMIHSPAEMAAAWPTTVTTSRCPRALARRTQKPFSALW
jgi:hypothetical protein